MENVSYRFSQELITGSSDVKYGHIVSIYSHHKHKDGSYGIADLQGFKEEDKC